jgi:hypothetical protein
VLNVRVTAEESVLFRQLGEEAVLLSLARGAYFGLDPVGTRMWLALTAAPSAEDALATLVDEYDVDPAALRADLAELLDKLRSAGLVRVEPVVAGA